MGQICYRPWSSGVLDECVSVYQDNGIPVIDLDLTAQCSMVSCLYCDSAPSVVSEAKSEMPISDTLDLLSSAVERGLRWIYTCGIGEPLEDSRFWEIVEFASTHSVGLSLFTNGLLIGEAEARRLRQARVCMLLKMDSASPLVFDHLLGVEDAAERIYRAYSYLLESGYGEVDELGATDLALAVVPTKVNYQEIPQIIRRAVAEGVYPSIGELENAGRASDGDVRSKLALSEDEAAWLVAEIDKEWGARYVRPVCPAAVTGLHIDNDGSCIVDKVTGLNCKWFMMEEPDVISVGSAPGNTIEEMDLSARSYRRNCFAKNGKLIASLEDVEFQFGGCGGSPRDIIGVAKRTCR